MVSAGVSIATAARRLGARRARVPILKGLSILLLVGGHTMTASASENVPFEELGGDQCFMFSQLVPTRTEGNNIVQLPLELVINDDAAFLKLFDPGIMRQSCANVDPSKRIPAVDLSRQTVLGLWSSGSCAVTGFEKKVLRDDIQKSIIYSVSAVSAQRRCMGPGRESLNLIAIPKVPAGYKVVFENIPE